MEKFTGQWTIKKKRLILCAFSFAITFLAMYLLYFVLHVAPFGNRALAWEDADIQYLDFFSYFRDVLFGKNKISYSMTNTLGDGGIGLYSYYLASPFNLLVVFFRQSQLEVFFTLIVALKIATASLTACYYLQVRFVDQIHMAVTVMLACGYGMMQYDLAQCANVMWLDGVYMLPLMLLGVYKVIEKKQIHPLAIATACSILFNWYTAGINCLFSILFFAWEYLLSVCRKKISVKDLFFTILRYGVAMVLGVCISAVLFLPTVVDLRGGKGSSFNLELLQRTFNGRLTTVIRDYTIGGISRPNEVSLFAGSVILIGCIAFFSNRNYWLREKLIVGIGLLFCTSMFFFTPTHLLFSLFKKVLSYWFRYAYISIFYLMFVAALGYQKPDRKIRYWLLAILYAAVYYTFSYEQPKYDRNQVYLTILLLLIVASGVHLLYRTKTDTKRYFVIACGLLLVVMLELEANACYLCRNYSLMTAEDYTRYVDGTNRQLEALAAYDDDSYRISQTSRRNNLAHLNESMSYNYWGNSGYTSSPDNRQLKYLDRLGYKEDGDCLNVVADSVISADSLLGVKYILSKRSYPGLRLVKEIAQENGKYVYENPYCLPLACVYKPVTETEAYTNPFEYQNQLYSELCGENVALYEKLEVHADSEDKTRIYHIQIPEGNYVVYGNIVTNVFVGGKVGRTGEDGILYSNWMAPSVFYIEHAQDEREISVTFHSDQTMDLKDEQFYALNLDVLASVSAQICEKEPQSLSIENGYATCTVDGKNGENLYLSIPYEEGWTIRRNGEKIEAGQFAECMMSIPLVDGENKIELVYHIPYMWPAIGISLFGIAVLAGIIIFRRRKA